jgi:peptide/nickel transport system substrate-binding protein
MQTRSRGAIALAGFATLAVLATACGGSSSGGGPEPSGSSDSGAPSGYTKISLNDEGTPVKGGTLNVLGSSDVDYLDPNITYYSLGQSVMRAFSRQLYTYPAVQGHQTESVPDLATGEPEVSEDGLEYKITIREGAKWNTTPERQVTAEDVVRGVKTTCNPFQPYGGEPNFDFLIVGLKKFCKGFAGIDTNAKAIADYTENTDLPGVTADPSNPLTVIFKLTQPASYFRSQLSLTPFSPRPKEMLDYVPASSQAAQHTISDGPYEVESYEPTKQLTLVRNDAWDESTDPVRKAYVDKIIISMTNDVEAVQKQLQTDTPSADLAFNGVPATDLVQLIAKDDPNLNVEGSISSNPYVLYNTVSPNNNGALKKVEVRQALSRAINRTHLIQVAGGPKISPPLTHVLPPEIDGSENFDLYPNDPDKAKADLAAAGADNMTLKFLYRPASPTSTKMYQTIQNDLGKIGIKVKGVQSPDADFYTKYLQVPSVAREGTWDLSLAGWGPDWYGNAALSFFSPLFDGRVLPPTSSDFGLFNDEKVNGLIDQAKNAKTVDESLDLWAQADRAVMEAAAFFPITDPNEGTYHASHVHHTVFMPPYQTVDFTNVWLEEGSNGG